MAQKISAPITSDPNDPILALWTRWKSRVYFTVLAVLGIIVVLQLVSYFREASLRGETEAVIEVRDATSLDGAAAKVGDLSGSEAQATGLGILMQRHIGTASSSEPAEISGSLEKANEYAQRLKRDFATTFAGKLVKDGSIALRHDSAEKPPADALATYADRKAVDAVLLPPALPESASKVSLPTSLGNLEFVLAAEKAPELCAAFQQAAENGSFEGLLLYKPADQNMKGGVQFGDPRLKHDLSTEALPSTSFWGRGPNLAPLPAKDTGLFLWKGWVGAVLDPQTGMISAREIVIATKDPDLGDSMAGNQVVVPFARLTDESLGIAQKIQEALEAVEKEQASAKSEDESAAGAAPALTKTSRPFVGKPK